MLFSASLFYISLAFSKRGFNAVYNITTRIVDTTAFIEVVTKLSLAKIAAAL